MPKSNKLYAIVVLDKAELRDEFLSDLLGQEYKPKLEEAIYLYGNYKRVYHTKYLAWTKTWKTESGAQKFLNIILDHTNQIENVRKSGGKGKHPFDDWLLESNGKRNWQEFKFVVYEITEEWNKDIDRRIERETQNFKKKVESLQKQKLL